MHHLDRDSDLKNTSTLINRDHFYFCYYLNKYQELPSPLWIRFRSFGPARFRITEDAFGPLIRKMKTLQQISKVVGCQKRFRSSGG